MADRSQRERERAGVDAALGSTSAWRANTKTSCSSDDHGRTKRDGVNERQHHPAPILAGAGETETDPTVTGGSGTLVFPWTPQTACIQSILAVRPT